MPSFAVSYGLALQGLNRSQLRTNLLPPEVEQVRLLRRKKPWALAASALLMLGFASLYLGDYKAFAKVADPSFKGAVERAKSTAGQGSGYASAYASAKTEFETKLKEGKALIIPDDQRAAWPRFFQLVNDNLPDPAVEYHLNPGNPNDVKVLDKLRVHVDRSSRSSGPTSPQAGSTTRRRSPSRSRSRSTRSTATRPTSRAAKAGSSRSSATTTTLTRRSRIASSPRPSGRRSGRMTSSAASVLPRFQSAELRALGIHHVALTWKVTDSKPGRPRRVRPATASSPRSWIAPAPRARPAQAPLGAWAGPCRKIGGVAIRAAG